MNALQSTATSTAKHAHAGKYLTFHLAAEEYGVEILKVREIIGLMKITRVPRASAHIRGVINLRGKVIPVLDLRCRFGMDITPTTEQTCVIVVEIAVAGGAMMMGLVVDAVSEVLAIGTDQIEDAPTWNSQADCEFILGIAKVKNEVKILLDIDRVLTSDDEAALSAVSQPGDLEEAVSA